MFLSDLPRATAQAAFATPEKALSSEERVPAAALRALAQGGPERVCGVISLEDQAALAMYLPDIIGELLVFRALATITDGTNGLLTPNQARQILEHTPIGGSAA